MTDVEATRSIAANHDFFTLRTRIMVGSARFTVRELTIVARGNPVNWTDKARAAKVQQICSQIIKLDQSLPRLDTVFIGTRAVSIFDLHTAINSLRQGVIPIEPGPVQTFATLLAPHLFSCQPQPANAD